MVSVHLVLERLKAVRTRSELDAMRPEVVAAMESDGTKETFAVVQSAFIKAKHRIQRSRDGGWWR